LDFANGDGQISVVSQHQLFQVEADSMSPCWLCWTGNLSLKLRLLDSIHAASWIGKYGQRFCLIKRPEKPQSSQKPGKTAFT
jgi:hypothetical protein